MKLTNEQDAIKQAIQAGWSKESQNFYRFFRVAGSDIGGVDLVLDSVFTDPAFWQALGKARGWEPKIETGSISLWDVGKWPMVQETWKHHALRYFETRFSKGDISAFWASLP